MKTLKTTAQIALLAFLACLALVVFGLLFTVYTAPPARAFESRVATPPVTQPVPAADVIAWNNWLQPVLKAMIAKGGPNDPEYRAMMAAINTANGAIAQDNNTQFQNESAAAKIIATRVCARIGGC